jgi:uncharacterized protein (TIGR03437 family)
MWEIERIEVVSRLDFVTLFQLRSCVSGKLLTPSSEEKCACIGESRSHSRRRPGASWPRIPLPTLFRTRRATFCRGCPISGSRRDRSSSSMVRTWGPAISIAPSLPLPNALSGTSIQVTVGDDRDGADGLHLNTQIAAVLPSNTPIGSGTLTVKCNNGTGSTSITVVKSNFGISTVNQTGTGPAVVTFGDYSVISGSKSAKAGDTLILWGTGLGPIMGDDSAAPTPVDLGTPITVYVGGVQANLVYRGRSAEPGLDQINFVVPSGVTGCAVSVLVQTGNLVSNTTTMAIASDNRACSDPSGISVSAFTPVLSSKGTVSVGVIDLFQDSIAIKIGGQSTTTNAGFGSAVFEKYAAEQIGSITGLLGQGSLGSCTVTNYSANLNSGSSGSTTPEPTPIPSVIGLDAGASITVTPPSGSPIVLKPTSNTQKGDYSGQVTAIPTGAYTNFEGERGSGHWSVHEESDAGVAAAVDQPDHRCRYAHLQDEAADIDVDGRRSFDVCVH